MYEQVKNKMKRDMYSRNLAAVVAATLLGPTSCAYLPEVKAKELDAAQAGLILINPNVKDAEGNIGVRATDAAIALVNATPAPKAPKPEAPKMEFKIESGVEIPFVQRGARVGVERYPFSKLEPKDSFFIPSSEAQPNPAKSLASTVSAATRRFAEKDAEGKVIKHTRKFVIREVEGGARVWRTQ